MTEHPTEKMGLRRLLFLTGAYAGIYAFCFTAASALVVGWFPDPVACAAASTLAAYAYGLNRLRDLDRDWHNRRDTVLACVPHRRWLWVVNGVLLALSAVLASTMSTPALALWVLCLILAVAYSVPAVPNARGRLITLGYVGLAKPFVVGACWGMACVAVPLVSGLRSGNCGVLPFIVCLVSVTVLMSLNVIAGDCLDVEGDRRSGVRTFAVRFGVQRVLRWCGVWDILMILACVAVAVVLAPRFALFAVFFALDYRANLRKRWHLMSTGGLPEWETSTCSTGKA